MNNQTKIVLLYAHGQHANLGPAWFTYNEHLIELIELSW